MDRDPEKQDHGRAECSLRRVEVTGLVRWQVARRVGLDRAASQPDQRLAISTPILRSLDFRAASA